MMDVVYRKQGFIRKIMKEIDKDYGDRAEDIIEESISEMLSGAF